MKCIACKEPTKVIDSREDINGKRRRRQCVKCGVRFTTHEAVDPQSDFAARTRKLQNLKRDVRLLTQKLAASIE